jgi:superfamily II DNA or RNA helicase/HKD family nuclease
MMSTGPSRRRSYHKFLRGSGPGAGMRYRAMVNAEHTGRPIDALATAPESSWLAANDLAYVIAVGPDLLLTTRRSVTGWQQVHADERAALFALIEALGVRAGSLRFELATAGRWHMRLEREGSVFAGLPGFSDGDGQQLLPALRQGLARASAADLLAAFLQPTGVALLYDDLEDALRRGAHVRILTGDYLGFTDPGALRTLLALAARFPAMEVAVYCCEGRRSFHAKAYIFRSGAEAVAYVGSSNLSHIALTTGVEWNLRAVSRAQADELAAIRAGFERLWSAPATVALTSAWIDQYADRPRPPKGWDPPPAPPEPHAIQIEALAALRAAWDGGARRGLVVLATGLGKTLLAAFAAREMGAMRVLFLAHRDEILDQGSKAFARVLPERSCGRFSGPRREREAELLFATVQTLARPEHLSSFPPDHFDLVIVDEFHHAAAASYRRVIDHFTPTFMLGLTATPERGDGAELLALCEDRLIHRAGLIEGIARRLLVPFTYRGIKDDIDYAAIPWRRGRFAPEALDEALTRESHAAQALAQYLEHAGPSPRRGLWFCASIAHAEYIAAFLTGHGVAAEAVHSGPTGASRSESLRRLGAGELQAIAAVDVFNEGIDVPDIDVVVLLRPTESRVVFLQQIGRGLRLPVRSQKSRLLILDFIGNHDSFLRKPQALMFLLGRALSRDAATRALREGKFELPEGCSVTIDTEVIELLGSLARENAGDFVLSAFMRLRDRLGRRPALADMIAEGIMGREPARLFGTWWDLLARLDELDAPEARVLAARQEELAALESAAVGEAGPWQSLRAWIALGGVSEAVAAASLDGGASAAIALVKLWARALVQREGRVGLVAAVDAADQPVLEDMLAEIAEARVVEAGRIASARPGGPSIVLKVSHNSSSPILRLSSEAGEFAGARTDVWIEGEPYALRGTGVAINVAEAAGGGRNVLPGLLRRMFGLGAGATSTRHYVALQKDERGRWNLRPRYATPPVSLPFYAELAVACGVGDVQHSGADDVRTLTVHSPVSPGARDFLVRARGDSMDGGKMPIRDGDIVLCSRLAGGSPVWVEHEACLLIADDGPGMSEAMLKVPVRLKDGSWALRSWAEGQLDLPVDRWNELRVVARVLAVVQPAVSSDK